MSFSPASMTTIDTEVKLKHYTESDYAGLLDLMKDCYGEFEENYASSDDMNLLVKSSPDAQLLAVIDNEVVGCILSLAVKYDEFVNAKKLEDIYNPSNFESFSENSDSLFALEILVKSTHKRKGIGKLLNVEMTRILEEKNKRAFIGISRLSGYSKHQTELSIEEYVEQVKSSVLTDPSLSYNCSNNMLPRTIIPNYYPKDYASCGYGAIVVQENSFYTK
jgi:hypothetical protein